MKFATLAALVAVAYAQDEETTEEETVVEPQYPGTYCDNDASVCQESGTTCVSWKDSNLYPRASCQDCLEDNRTLLDEYNEEATFFCPGEEEKASTLAFSAAAILAAVTMMQ